MITVRLKAGQGNQMFQYAFGRALALRNKDTLALDLTFLLDRTPRKNFVFRDYDLDVFNIDEHLTLLSRAAIRTPVPLFYFGVNEIAHRAKFLLGTEKHVSESSGFDPASIPAKGNIYIDGYWQDEKYFRDVAGVIRKDFTLRSRLSAPSEKMAAEIRAANAICVNVRRADFVSVKRSIATHGFVGLEYYAKGMEEIKRRAGASPSIYVFSDEIEWCRQNLVFPGMAVTYVGHEYRGKKFEEYLYLMSLCKHFLIPNSTFGWWAAWLAANPGKVVVAPTRWYVDPSRKDDPALPSWIRI